MRSTSVYLLMLRYFILELARHPTVLTASCSRLETTEFVASIKKKKALDVLLERRRRMLYTAYATARFQRVPRLVLGASSFERCSPALLMTTYDLSVASSKCCSRYSDFHLWYFRISPSLSSFYWKRLRTHRPYNINTEESRESLEKIEVRPLLLAFFRPSSRNYYYCGVRCCTTVLCFGRPRSDTLQRACCRVYILRPCSEG